VSAAPKSGRLASYSTADVAARLGVSVPTVQRWVDAGHLKAWKTVGGHRRIDAQSAERLFQGRLAGSELPTDEGGGPATVIIVDDNPDDRDLLAAIVKRALPEAHLTVFDNAIQALVAIGQRAPTVLITDIVMPYMDGLEMLRQLADRCVVSPALIVAVSANCDAKGRPRHVLPERVHFVPKPIDADALAEMLRSVDR
jgi:excisionase family DNA binding protein